MEDLLKAIIDEKTGTTFNTALSGGLYHLEAKQKTGWPYGVFYIVSDLPHWTFTSNMEEVVVHFNLFSKTNGVAEICALFKKLKTCYDWCVLSIDNYTNIFFKRELSELLRIDNVWQYAISYRIELEES